MDFVSIVCQMENLHLQGRRWVEGGILCHEVSQLTLVEYILVELVIFFVIRPVSEHLLEHYV